MPLVLADRVIEQTTTQGTNNFELIGTSAGYQAFSVVGNGSTVYYTAEGINDDGTLTGQWEVGIGVYNAGVLSRDTILSSSTGSKVSFSAGQKNVFIDLPSEKAVVLDDTDKVSGYNISGGTINGTSIGATTPSTGRFTSVTTPSVTATTNDLTLSSVGTNSVLISSGNGTQFKVNNTYGAGGTAVNFFSVYGRQSGSSPIFAAEGTDSALSPIFAAKAGNFLFRTADITGANQFVISHTASAVNYVQVTGSVTGSGGTISSQGSDANIPIFIQSKGTGWVEAKSNGRTAFVMYNPSSSAVNYLQVEGRTSGNAPTILANGSDTDISLGLTSKGNGGVIVTSSTTGVNGVLYIAGGTSGLEGGELRLNGSTGNDNSVIDNYTGLLRFFNSNGAQHRYYAEFRGDSYRFSLGGTANTVSEQFRINHTASAVNYVQVTGASTTGSPSISAQGSDSTINFDIAAKGGGEIRFKPNGATTAVNFAVAFTANTVNYLTATGSGASGNAPRLYPQGSDTNISMIFQPKGTGSIDLASGSTGVNVSNGTTVTAITRTNPGSLYTSIPSVAISAPNIAGGVQATASLTMAAQSGTAVTPANGGTGYTLNDVLTLVGGTFTQAAQFTVTGVSGGVVTQVTRSNTNFGNYTVLPSSPAATTGGTGTGCTLNMVWEVLTIPITNAGSGYTSQPTVTFSGGGGSGASAYARIGNDTTIKGLGLNQLFATSGGVNFAVLDCGLQNPATYGALTGGSASAGFIPVSSNANAGVTFTSKGTSPLDFYTNSYGSLALRASHTASAVNYVQVTGAPTGSLPTISAQGSDTNIGFQYNTKGFAGSHRFQLGGSEAFRIEQFGATGVANRFSMFANVAGSPPMLVATGSDTNVGFDFSTKGTGIYRFSTNTANAGTGAQQFAIAHTASAVNFVQVAGGAAGNEVTISGQGSDAAVNVAIATKSTGLFRVLTASNEQFRVSNTASAVNYVQVTGSATVNDPVISAQGSDANIRMVLRSKGTLGTRLTSSDGSVQFATTSPTGTVNFLQVAPSAAGTSPVLSAQGSDTNINLTLTPKGTGRVQFGTHTATADTAISGYIEILDAGGTVRKLAVIS